MSNRQPKIGRMQLGQTVATLHQVREKNGPEYSEGACQIGESVNLMAIYRGKG